MRPQESKGARTTHARAELPTTLKIALPISENEKLRLVTGVPTSPKAKRSQPASATRLTVAAWAVPAVVSAAATASARSEGVNMSNPFLGAAGYT